MKENGRKRRWEKERIRGRGLESSEKGCNKKEREGAIGPTVSLLGIYNPMISFCTPAKPSHPRHRPWAKRSHGRVADIMVYCSQWCSNTFHFECLCAVTSINLGSLKDRDIVYICTYLKIFLKNIINGNFFTINGYPFLALYRLIIK